ncbi:MAG: hypothetical protein H6691_09025, partial [Gemmatimonadales bacterium]|nr:hypothetical protein [Gemmatimonadales bacterium]
RWTMAQVHAFLCGREVPLAEGGTAELPVDVADPGVTQVLTAPAPPVQTSTRRRVAPPTEPPSAAAAASPEEPRPRRGPATALLVAAALLVALLGVAWGVGHLGGDPGGGAASTGADPSRASDTPTQAESSGTPSADEPTVDDMRAFVASYLTAATSDQKASWAMLTPSFQKASGGYGQYKKFWQQQQAAELVSFSADPDNLTVEYDVRYTRDGAHPVDHVRLQLAYAGGDYLIDGEG